MVVVHEVEGVVVVVPAGRQCPFRLEVHRTMVSSGLIRLNPNDQRSLLGNPLGWRDSRYRRNQGNHSQ